jgi:predicted 3-demethylubiquinone-9 3-methyltransferase (glyoxalase superfamily)
LGQATKETAMQKIVTHLWFEDQAEEAARFYTGIFKNSRIGQVARYGKAGAEVSGRPENSVMTVDFTLDGQDFIALNGGPHFKFSEAISLLVKVKDQAELDQVWDKLCADGGKGVACGWLKDKYGLSWQVVPEGFEKLLVDPDKSRSERAMQALLKMVKLDIAAIQRAADGR